MFEQHQEEGLKLKFRKQFYMIGFPRFLINIWYESTVCSRLYIDIRAYSSRYWLISRFGDNANSRKQSVSHLTNQVTISTNLSWDVEKRKRNAQSRKRLAS